MMNWAIKLKEAMRCSLAVYTCAKYDKNPIQCVKESKCEIPKQWLQEDKYETVKQKK